jgi:hypothetical protein
MSKITSAGTWTLYYTGSRPPQTLLAL